MKKNIIFRTCKCAPEINRAYINEVEIPGYVPSKGTYEYMLRDLRFWFRMKRSQYLEITVIHTGGASSLPDETFNVGKYMLAKKSFLSWLRGRSRGVGKFIQPDGSYKEMAYDYKLKVKRRPK